MILFNYFVRNESKILIFLIVVGCLIQGCAGDNNSKPNTQIGQVYAFTSDRTGNHEVFIGDSNSDSVFNVTQHPATDYGIAWSPKGNKILFGSDRDGNREVYLVNKEGTELINLSNHPGSDAAADWSPDAKRIVFISDRDAPSREIYIMDSDGNNVTRITKGLMKFSV